MTKNRKKVIFFRLFYLLIVVILIYVLLFDIKKINEEDFRTTEITVAEAFFNEFGFYTSALDQKIDKVKKDQTLSDILYAFRIKPATIHQIANNSKEIFDVRNIKAGKTYHAFVDSEISNSLEYFVYEKDHVNYVVYDLRDSVMIYEGSKFVKKEQKMIAAVIDNSLYSALSERDAPSELAIRLSQIFAWQIDFYHLQLGDKFKIIYEENYIPVSISDNQDEENFRETEQSFEFVSLGKILGAYFQHKGKEFYAIPFMQDETFQYFDENGHSLRKAFLKAPLEFSRISSRFSYSRLHPVLSVHLPHLGVDYAAPIGTPVNSTGDGMVIESGYKQSSGMFIKIRHNSVYTTMYLHLSKFAKGIADGIHVKQGQVIGYVGSSGLSTGPHLDYRFYINGKPVNPLKIELPPSHPVKKELKEEFEKQKNETLTLLRLIDSEMIFKSEPYVLKKSSSK